MDDNRKKDIQENSPHAEKTDVLLCKLGKIDGELDKLIDAIDGKETRPAELHVSAAKEEKISEREELKRREEAVPRPEGEMPCPKEAVQFEKEAVQPRKESTPQGKTEVSGEKTDANLFEIIGNDEVASEKITAPRYSYWQSVFRVFFRNRFNIVILVLLGLILVFTYLYPVIIHYDPESDPFKNLLDPTSKHLSPTQAMKKFGSNIHWILGTGASGESTFDSVWYGSSISVTLAFVCAMINMTVGVIIGAFWGFSRKIDLFMTEVYNIIGNIPYILLISVLVLIFSASFWSMVFALTVTGWIGIAFFIRTQVIIIRNREYNLASRCLGTPLYRIAAKNILPFMTSVIVTLIATEIPSYISYEVFLSYIGMGLKDMSLGKLIQFYQSSMFVPGWEIEFWAPVVVASIITIVLYVAGQNLGDASDPRTHR